MLINKKAFINSSGIERRTWHVSIASPQRGPALKAPRSLNCEDLFWRNTHVWKKYYSF